MRFSDVRRVAERPEDVWRSLHEAVALQDLVPGCERLIPIGEGEYAAIVSAPADGSPETYRGLLTVTDTRPGAELLVELSGRGRCGRLEVEVHLHLQADPAQVATVVTHETDVWVGGRAPVLT